MSFSSVILRSPSCWSLYRVAEEKLASHPLCGSCKAALPVRAHQRERRLV